MVNTIEIFGVIGREVSADYVRSALNDLDGKDIEIHIDSPGGNLSEGVLIYNLIRAHSGNVTTVVLARAYSIASYIFLAGDNRHVLDNALVMTHEARVDVYAATEGACEQAKSMLAAANKSIRKRYAEIMGIDPAMVQTLWDAGGDLWYTSDEAIASNLATRVVTADSDLSAEFINEVMAMAPNRIKEIFSKGENMSKDIVSIEQLEAIGAPAAFILDQIKMKSSTVDAYAAYIGFLTAEKDDEKDDEKEDEKEDEDMDAVKDKEDGPDKEIDAKKDDEKSDEKDDEKSDGDDKPFAEEDKGDDEKDDKEMDAEEDEDDDEKDVDKEEGVAAELKNLHGAQPVAQQSGSREMVSSTSLWNSKISDKVNAGMTSFNAILAVSKEFPQLRSDMLSEVNR